MRVKRSFSVCWAGPGQLPSIPSHSRPGILLLAILAILFLAPSCAQYRNHVYLTWQGETSTTITINYHSRNAETESIVHYDTESRDGVVADYAHQTTGEARQIEGLRDGRFIHSVELTGLAPNTTYYFVVGNPGRGKGKEYHFTTLPNAGEPVRFISGGDIHILPAAERLLRQAGRLEPDFAVIGGDLAYADGDPDKAFIWDIYLRNWQKQMRHPDGALIPMILAIGNHEVNDLEGPPERRAPFYYGYFPQGGSSYFQRDIAGLVNLIVLDSGHIVPFEEQVDWLDGALAENTDFPFSVAVYHIPFYPSYRSFDDHRAVAGRTHWMPLFDAYELDVAFENHDHTFKRSKRLRHNAVHPEGTLYLGDGSMGALRNKVDADNPRWYLEVANNTQHFWLVDVDADHMHFQAVDHRGRVFDSYELPVSQ